MLLKSIQKVSTQTFIFWKKSNYHSHQISEKSAKNMSSLILKEIALIKLFFYKNVKYKNIGMKKTDFNIFNVQKKTLSMWNIEQIVIVIKLFANNLNEP